MSITDREMTSTTHQDFLPTVWADDTRDAIKFAEVLSKLVVGKVQNPDFTLVWRQEQVSPDLVVSNEQANIEVILRREHFDLAG